MTKLESEHTDRMTKLDQDAHVLPSLDMIAAVHVEAA
jgi:hypothetical protein